MELITQNSKLKTQNFSIHPFYLAVGHITQDRLPDDSFTPGGTVSFAALAAQRQGARAAILTAAPDFVKSDRVFEGIQISGPTPSISTIFENIYTLQGRTQYVRSVAPALSLADVPDELAQAADIVHLGPVAQECSPELVRAFPNALIGATPQGWMRHWDAGGRVSAIEWQSAAEILPHINALVLSQEDLPGGEVGQALLESYVKLCPVVVCTQGPNGCDLYWQGRRERLPAYPATEVDPTGAGDIFAASFFIKLYQTGDPVTAADFANAAASVSIEQSGLASVPTLTQIQARQTARP